MVNKKCHFIIVVSIVLLLIAGIAISSIKNALAVSIRSSLAPPPPVPPSPEQTFHKCSPYCHTFNTVITLKGVWTADGGIHKIFISTPYRVTPPLFTIDMSAYHRPSAYGNVFEDSTINVFFPDDKGCCIGKLEPPNIIKWSNGSVWKWLGLHTTTPNCGLPTRGCE